MAQTAQFQLRNSSDNIVTGQASNLEFRVSPYSTAIGGLTFTETPSSSGVYVVTGIASYYKNVKLFLSGTEQTAYGVFDIGSHDLNFVELTGDETIGGVKTFSSPPIVPQAVANGQPTRYQDVWRATGNQTGLSGIKVTSDLIAYSPSDITITGDGTHTSKKYVDDLFATATGNVQSVQKIKLIPSRAITDAFSAPTLDGCIGQLNLATGRGNAVIECLATAGNVYTVADGEIWLIDSFDITGENAPKIDLSNQTSTSWTADSKLKDLHLYNSTAGNNWTLVNATFDNCDLDFAGNLTLTSCKFKGVVRIKVGASKTLTIANSTGTTIFYNDNITTVNITGTQVVDIRAVASADLGL